MTAAVVGALGQRIRERREKLGMTQGDVAHGLQVTAQAVSKWERGENAPDVGVLVALGRLLGVSLDWLLGGHAPSTEGGQPEEVFDATVFVADITGSSMATATLSKRDVATWLNGRLFQITEAVLRHDGIPVSYQGDSALAFFAGTDHRDRAVRAAFLARRTMDTLIHVGLDAGPIFVGRIGHPDYARMDILGEAVWGAYWSERWASKNTASHVAATQAVLDSLTDPVDTVESGTLDLPPALNAQQRAVRGLRMPS